MSDFENLDYYALLGVTRSATPEEIKRAYRQEISKYHPDRFANATPAVQEYASRRSQRITEAYSVLSDPSRRTAYNRGQEPARDAVRRAPPPPSQPRDHQAELYEQAREHLAADRLLQAIGALRQLRQINPFYRDSADLLANAETQLQAHQRRASGRRSRQPLIIAGGLIGGAAVVAIVALAFAMNRDTTSAIGGAGATRAPVAAGVTAAPTAPPLPTVTPIPPTAAPTQPELTLAPTAAPTQPEPTLAPTLAPTAAPAAVSPTAAAESGTLLFADTFSDGGWADTGGAGWRVGYQRGHYRVAVDAGYGAIWSYRTGPAADVSVGVDVQAPSGEGGLLLRFLDANNYLSFSVNPHQTSYRFEQHSGGGVTVLAGGQSEAIQAGGDVWNRLVARLRGDHIQLLINGQQLAELDAPAAPNDPRYGLVAIASDTAAEAFFDNLQIRQVEN
ncbi:MAG TPA: DnaJ domain-containing protein [Roseiflexaceae bacterium]